jgi:hypothetical protein
MMDMPGSQQALSRGMLNDVVRWFQLLTVVAVAICSDSMAMAAPIPTSLSRGSVSFSIVISYRKRAKELHLAMITHHSVAQLSRGIMRT